MTNFYDLYVCEQLYKQNIKFDFIMTTTGILLQNKYLTESSPAQSLVY